MMKRVPLPEEIEQSITEIREDFRSNPGEFLIEFHIKKHLIDSLQGRYEPNRVETNIYVEEDSVSNYKKGYARSIRKTEKIDRVKGEVNIGEGKSRGDEFIDICVFKDRPVSVTYNGGSKYFDPNDIQTAIEVKYVKNDNLLSASSWDGASAPGRVDEIEDRIDDSNNQFFKDIDKLARLERADNRILLVVSNHNIFQQPKVTERWADNENKGVDSKSSSKAIGHFENLKEVLEDAGIVLRDIHLPWTEEDAE